MTIKTLLLLRHAKSSWKNPGQQDHDRPLNARGKRDAPQMGRRLAELDLIPDFILSSTAKRARKTAEKVAEAMGFEGVLELTKTLYLADIEEHLTVLLSVPDSVERVLVIAHNPGLQNLVFSLTGLHQEMPTTGLAQIELAIQRWAELSEKPAGRLVNFWRPDDPLGDG